MQSKVCVHLMLYLGSLNLLTIESYKYKNKIFIAIIISKNIII